MAERTVDLFNFNLNIQKDTILSFFFRNIK